MLDYLMCSQSIRYLYITTHYNQLHMYISQPKVKSFYVYFFFEIKFMFCSYLILKDLYFALQIVKSEQ